MNAWLQLMGLGAVIATTVAGFGLLLAMWLAYGREEDRP